MSQRQNLTPALLVGGSSSCTLPGPHDRVLLRFSKFPVLIVTTGPERVANMLQAYQEHSGERDLDATLFLDRRALRQGSVLDSIRRNSRSVPVSRLPKPYQERRTPQEPLSAAEPRFAYQR